MIVAKIREKEHAISREMGVPDIDRRYPPSVRIAAHATLDDRVLQDRQAVAHISNDLFRRLEKHARMMGGVLSNPEIRHLENKHIMQSHMVMRATVFLIPFFHASIVGRIRDIMPKV